MTAAAIDYRADRVMIAADSACYDDEGTIHGYAPKVFGFAAQRCLLFARGKSGVTINVVRRILAQPTLHTFEDLTDALPDYISGAAAAFYKDHGLELPTVGNNSPSYYELVLCGLVRARATDAQLNVLQRGRIPGAHRGR
jgi:hypothetical protein